VNDDELRHRLRELDPVPSEVAMEPPTTTSARARLEHIMNTDTTTEASEADARKPGLRSRSGRTGWLLAGAAAVVLLIGVVAVAVAGDDDGDGSDDLAAGPPLELSLGANDAMASCMPVDADILADMPLAFAGTATAVEPGAVTLDVDEWYTDGDAATVELQSGDAHPALIAGFEFEVGSRYLVSATEGTVNFCGFSGPATPELTALFEDAFHD
jgi:hypothetical protein